MNTSGPSREGFAQSVGATAGRGAALVAVAVLIGLFLLWQGFDDGGSSATTSGEVSDTAGDESSSGDNGDAAITDTTASGDETATTAATDGATGTDTSTGVDGTGALHDPSEILVMPANATGEAGLASSLSDQLKVQNYLTDPANGTLTDASRILCRPDYCTDATTLAAQFGWDIGLVQALEAGQLAPVDTNDERNLAAHIVLIMGADGVIR